MVARRSTGKSHVARAVWYAAPGKVELRPERLAPCDAGQALVRTLFTGISRGTERLVLNGRVPASEWGRMRAPMQAGAFPFPVKYGYCATGVVESGPTELHGRHVFCLHPHQDLFVAPVEMLVPLPAGLLPKRATLAANMETALNALWDSGAGPGDRILVVGAGIVGLLVGYLAARLPGTNVTVTDVAAARRPIVEAMGAAFAAPDALGDDADVVFHTTAHPSGLATALGAGGLEATIVEMSWYGEQDVAAPLGKGFHSRRLRLLSSQVGQVSPSRRPRWTYRRRMEKALELLCDDRLDRLVTRELLFDDVALALPKALGETDSLPPVIRY